MERVFIKSTASFRVGDIRDYPIFTWKQLAKSVRVPLEKLAVPVSEMTKQSKGAKVSNG